MNLCDKCGLEDSDCQCYVKELENRIESLENNYLCSSHEKDGRIEFLEIELDKLTFIVEKMNEILLSLPRMP